MKSPLGSIVRAGNTADGDANANMVAAEIPSSRPNSTHNNNNGSDNNSNNTNNNKAVMDARQRSLDEAKRVLASLSAAPPKKEVVESKPPPAPPVAESDTPDAAKFTPKSRSDAVAAAKRRAEERRKGASKQHSKPNDAQSPSSATAAAAAATAATTNKSNNATVINNTNDTNSMDWFNLLGPVANPSGIDPDAYHYNNHHNNSHYNNYSSHSNHNHRISRHNASNHGSISHDHASNTPLPESYATTFFHAAGMSDLATSVETTAAHAAEGIAQSLDGVTDWFDRYSRKYLGNLPGIDGSLLPDGGDDGYNDVTVSGMMRPRRGSINDSSILWQDYTPEFGPDDIPEWQLEILPSEIVALDLNSVEEYLRMCGMLGMRFEDRGGGFWGMREVGKRRRRQMKVKRGEGGDHETAVHDEDDDIGITTTMATDSLTMINLRGEETDAAEVTEAIEAVPELFYSPYFDLTDPICFEKLLVVSDEEVAEIREKEARLHALAEERVREAEEVAKRDAENGVVAPRPPPRHSPKDASSAELTDVRHQSGDSLTRDAHRTQSPSDGNVITLRKPETFTAHLDAIELALLDQVRSKSGSFFRETNRFSELQHLVTASVDEVRTLRTDLQSLRERCVTNVELVPIMDNSRRELRQISLVLEAAEDVVNCKASIASLMSAGDHLGAVEAIRLARSLLAASPEDENHDDKSNDVSSNDGATNNNEHAPQHKLCLGKLKALSKVGEQLNEYEKLVVRNLTDDLVDTFLSWGSHQPGGDENGNGSVDYRSPPRVALSFEKRSKIRGVVQSLRLCGQLSGAGDAYRKRLCELISVTVKAIVTECVADAKTAVDNGTAESSGAQPKGTMAGVASMSLEQFIDCINMLFEQVLALLWGAVAVNKFCIEEGLIFDDKPQSTDKVTSGSGSRNGHSNDNNEHTSSATVAALAASVDLAEKSVSELLRLRREAHSLVSFDGMRRLWDTSLTFTLQLESFSGRKAYGLRSTLLSQAKAFVERKHEANMSTLAAAMDSERWVQCNVSAERQAALNRLCSGRAAFTSRNTNTRNIDNIASPNASGNGRDKMTDAEVEGNRYKVVWSCLLLLEMVMDDVACAAHFQTLATNVVGKVAELFRFFNTRSTQLVLGAGAIHSAARLKSINAKHLSIVTQCIALALAVLPHIRAALMAQLPAKQHALLSDLDKIKLDYSDHSEKILAKLVSIIGGIVEHSLAAKIPQTNFDNLAGTASSSLENDILEPTPFIDSVLTNTKKMHQVLNVMLPPDLLRDVFSQIFAYLDQKVPSLYKNFAAVRIDPNAPNKTRFSMPTTEYGKKRMVSEVDHMTKTLNCLDGVQPWHFTATKVLERELDIEEEEPEEDYPSSHENVCASGVDDDEKKETEEEAQQGGTFEPQAENSFPDEEVQVQETISTEPQAEHASPTSNIGEETEMDSIETDVENDMQINDPGKDKCSQEAEEDNQTIEIDSLVQSLEEDKSHTT